MNVIYRSKNLEKTLTNKTACRKSYGNLTEVLFKKMELRRTASNLPELRNISGHLHELKYQAKGIFALTVKHPFRLILAPMDDKSIAVITIEDYHGSPRKIQNYIN